MWLHMPVGDAVDGPKGVHIDSKGVFIKADRNGTAWDIEGDLCTVQNYRRGRECIEICELNQCYIMLCSAN